MKHEIFIRPTIGKAISVFFARQQRWRETRGQFSFGCQWEVDCATVHRVMEKQFVGNHALCGSMRFFCLCFCEYRETWVFCRCELQFLQVGIVEAEMDLVCVFRSEKQIDGTWIHFQTFLIFRQRVGFSRPVEQSCRQVA